MFARDMLKSVLALEGYDLRGDCIYHGVVLCAKDVRDIKYRGGELTYRFESVTPIKSKRMCFTTVEGYDGNNISRSSVRH